MIPSAILGVYQQDVFRGTDEGSTGGDDAPQRDEAAVAERKGPVQSVAEEVGLQKLESTTGSGYNNQFRPADAMDRQMGSAHRSGALSVTKRRQNGDVPTTCSTSRCSFEVSASGVLHRVASEGCAEPACQFITFDGFGIKSIDTDAFSGMVHLKVLVLTNNEISSISNDRFQDLVALEELYLGSNSLTSIAGGTFEGMSSLQSLFLLYNKIQSISADSFAGLSGLRRLNVEKQMSPSLQIIEDGSFRHTPNLEELVLAGHRLGSISNETFGDGLSKLKKLDLEGIYSSTETSRLTVESHAFAGLSGLERLKFGRSRVASESLQPGLFFNCKNLTYLDLFLNPIVTLSQTAFAGLENSLQTLNLHSCQLSRLGPRTFTGLSKLVQLSLSNNRLTVVPLELFLNMYALGSLTGYYAYVNNNPLACRPKVASDVEAGSGVWYPPAGRIYPLDMSLPLCPAEVRILHTSAAHRIILR